MYKSNIFIIKKLYISHRVNVEISKEIIRVAKRTGFDAIKFQTHSTDKMTLTSKKFDFIIFNGTFRTEEVYTNCTNRSIPLGSGIKNYSKLLKKKN